MDECTNCGCINGIKCEVESCKYHTTDNCCTASNIQVGNYSAKKNSETQCNTFKACN